MKPLLKIPTKKVFFCVFFSALVFPVFCSELKITEKAITCDLLNQYDRVFRYSAASSADIYILLNNVFKISAGVSFGGNYQYNQINAFGSVVLNYNFLKWKFFKYLYTGFFYLYDGLPKYEFHSHSFIPTIAVKGGRAGITLGFHSRHSDIYDEKNISESIIAFSIYFRLLNSKLFILDIFWQNFDIFYAGSFGDYYLGLQSEWKINKNISITNDLNVYQSGSVGLTALFYGISLRSGVKIKW